VLKEKNIVETCLYINLQSSESLSNVMRHNGPVGRNKIITW